MALKKALLYTKGPYITISSYLSFITSLDYFKGPFSIDNFTIYHQDYKNFFMKFIRTLAHLISTLHFKLSESLPFLMRNFLTIRISHALPFLSIIFECLFITQIDPFLYGLLRNVLPFLYYLLLYSISVSSFASILYFFS